MLALSLKGRSGNTAVSYMLRVIIKTLNAQQKKRRLLWVQNVLMYIADRLVKAYYVFHNQFIV